VDQITARTLPTGIHLTDNHDGTATLSGTSSQTSGQASITFTASNPNMNTAVRKTPYTGTAVILDASPSSGFTFSGWGTNCTGTGTCDVTMTSDEFVTATLNTPDFSIQPASASLTAQRGAQVTDVITVAPLNGSFSNPVQVSCAVTGSMPLATCSLSATSVTLGANSVTSTLTITASTQLARLTLPGERQLPSPLYAVFLPIPLALIGLGLSDGKSKNRRRSLWLLCSFFITSVVLQAGCGGGSSNQRTPPPPPLNYTVTVTATSGAIQHSTQIVFTVP
jgi:hypothetical protein